MLATTLDPKTWWYLSRASGLVGWLLLAASVLWGLFLSTRTLGKTAAPAWLLDLHRHLGGLAVVFVGVHMGGLALDNYVSFGLSDLLVPMATSWKPGPVAWGIVAFYLLVAIEITSLLQRRIPRRLWKSVHYLSFPLYVLATIHLVVAGTDRHNVLVRWAPVIATTLIVFLTIVRVLAARAAKARPAATPAGVTPIGAAAAADDPQARRAEMLARARAARAAQQTGTPTAGADGADGADGAGNENADLLPSRSARAT